MTARLLLVDTPPEDDPCWLCSHRRRYHEAPGDKCDCEGHGEAGLCACVGFTGPVEVTAEDVVDWLKDVHWPACNAVVDDYWLKCDCGLVTAVHRALADLTAPREDGA